MFGSVLRRNTFKVVQSTTNNIKSSTSLCNTIKQQQQRSYYQSSSSSSSSSSKSNNSFKWLLGATTLATSVLIGGTTLLDQQQAATPVEAVQVTPDQQSTDSKEDEKTTTTTPNTAAPVKPKTSDDPFDGVEKFKYIIIGGGTAAYHAVDKILENDKGANVLIITKEGAVPYQRPPLSKNLWHASEQDVAKLEFADWSGKKESIFFEPESVYGNDVLQVITKKKVVDLHVEGKVVLLNDGTLVSFEKLLIATGGEPRKINFSAKDDPNVTTYRTVEDFKQLYNRVHSDEVKHVTIIGGGFLGSELTCSINDSLKTAKKDIQVAQIFPEKGVLPLVLPQYLSDYATEEVRKSGVDIKPGKSVKDVTKNTETGKLQVKLDDGSVVDTDHVIVAVGLIPNADIAKSTQLEVDTKNGGYLVNAELMARSNIYVAGDVASFYDFSLGTRRRIEHHDHARATGELAGKNMTGAAEPYTYQPFFWSDLTNHIGFEATGNTDASLRTFSVWDKQAEDAKDQDKYSKGNIYYINDKDRVVGVLTFRHYGKMDKARELIQSAKTITDLNDLQHAISLEDAHH